MSRRYSAGPCDTCGYTSGPAKTEKVAAYGLRAHSCDKQLAAQARLERGRAQRAAVDRTPKPCLHKLADHQHGTHACYVLDRCRCTPCSTANTAYEHDRNRRHAYGRFNTYVDAQPVRAHVQHLVTAGIGLKRIGELAGVSTSSLGKLVYGTATRGPSGKVTRSNADRILAVKVTLEAYAPGARVPNVGTKRRLQALMAIGWSQTALAREVGMELRNFGHLLHGKRAVTAKNARIVADLYERLWDQTPATTDRWTMASLTRSLGYARRFGFAPPMAWDDEVIDDPAATPDLGDDAPKRAGRPLEHTVEDVEWFLREVDAMATVDHVAHRFGLTRSGVQQALGRAERRDLLDRLNRNAELAGHSGGRRTA